MNRSRLTLTAVASLTALVLVGVGQAADSSLYDWANYERDLHKALTEPKKAVILEVTLKEMIAEADAAGRKPPPGVLAEYGYFQLKAGDTEAAIKLFEREAREWPESEVLMKRMIDRARKEADS